MKMINVPKSDVAIFSIKPVYADKILSGKKKVEYRKSKCNRDIKKIIIYATTPIKMVVGEVDVSEIISGTPDEIWKLTFEQGGISKSDYEAYFSGKSVAFAYRLTKPAKFRIPRLLKEYGIDRAPQSFCYLKIE